MSKAVLFLADGMADESLDELGGKTPLEYANTANMDKIASQGASGTFLSLPKGFPTSSDVANMSVLGYDLAKFYPGRGPLEAVSQGITLNDNDIAWRCNLINVKESLIEDYSAGHIDNAVSSQLMNYLQEKLGTEKISFFPGVSYRNLILLHGKEFSDKVDYAKPDSSHGENVNNIGLKALAPEAEYTVKFLNEIISKAAELLEKHPLNRGKGAPANYIWPWSPGKKPNFQKFSEKYNGKKGAVISAVDVIFGIAKCAAMDTIKVEGATGFVDTNYEGKAAAALKSLEDHDFVYLHVEAPDECSHIGDLKLKVKAIEDFDSRIVGPVMSKLDQKNTVFAILPDHPVPIKLRKHTRVPVPVAVCGPHIKPDSIMSYSEKNAPAGSLGQMQGDQLIKLILDLK